MLISAVILSFISAKLGILSNISFILFLPTLANAGNDAAKIWGSILVIAAFGTLTITAAAKSLRLRS